MLYIKKIKKDVIHLFGVRLKELRKNHRLTQSDIANMFDVTKNAVYSWENGISQPSIEIITKLAQYFNVTTDYLLGFNQDDLDKIEKLKIACQEAGVMAGQDFTLEEFKKAMLVVKTLKDAKK